MIQNIATKRNKKTKEELTLKDDILFKAFFTKKGNEKYLKSFLEAVLDIKIHEIKVEQEVNLYKLTIDQKPGRLDIQATIDDGKIINVEMQVRDEDNIEQRTLFYGSSLITGQLKEGDKYTEIKPVILINILGFNIFEVPEYHTKTVTVLRENKNIEVIKDVQYHFIELPKFRKEKPELTNLLECWLAFIDNREGGLVEMATKKEPIIKEAKEEVEEILSNKALQEIIRYRFTAQLEENSRIGYAEEKGMKKGMQKGKNEQQRETAIEMLKDKVDIEKIIKYTGLSKEEIEELIKED